MDDLILTKEALRETAGQIENIVQLVAESNVTISTVRDKLHEYEDRKLALEERIKELSYAQLEIDVSEERICELVNQSRQFVETKDVSECRHFIESYIDQVLVYNDHVEVRFKINIPSENGDTQSLSAEETRKTLLSDYRAG